MAFTDLHVFPYSVRPRTAAAHFRDHIPFGIRKRRVQALLTRVPDLRRRYLARFVGRSLSVLWEEESKGYCRGLSDNYIRVYAPMGTVAPGALQAITAAGVFRDGVLGVPATMDAHVTAEE